MSQTTVEVSIPFKSLIECARELDFRRKRKLWKLLEEEIGQFEEKMLEKKGVIQPQIQEARNAYQSGDYVTIDEYVAHRKKPRS